VVSGKKHSKPTRPFEATEAEFSGHAWAGDFLDDRITSGIAIRIFNVLDVFSRRGFEPVVEYSLPAYHLEREFEALQRLNNIPRGPILLLDTEH